MNCKTLHKNLIFFLEKELPVSEMEQIQVHLNQCPECKLFFNEMKETLSILETEKAPEVNPFFYTRLKVKIEIKAKKPETFLRRPVFVKVLQPAIFSILLVIGIYSGLKIGQPEPTQMVNSAFSDQQMIPYLNEMGTESIEAFLME